MSIIEKLDKKISNQKKEKKLNDDKIKKDFAKVFDFWGAVYKKHLASDFIKLEKLFKKHVEKDKVIIKLTKSYPFSLEITELYSDKYTTIEIKLDHKHEDEDSVSTMYRTHESKPYKFLDTNFYIKVSSDKDYGDKQFELKDKEKSYEYLNDLFQRDILLLVK